MNNVLLVHSSVFGEKSQSLGLARDFLKRYPHRSLVERSLTPQTMPHLDGETFAAMGTPAGELTGSQQAAGEGKIMRGVHGACSLLRSGGGAWQCGENAPAHAAR